MRIFNESEILDLDFRKRVIDEIEDVENVSRKKESYKRYEIYKDRIKKYILEQLLLELDPATVSEMQSRVSTVNMYKKIVQKKARVYKAAPERRSVEENEQEFLDLMVDALGLNTVMKKVNRYVEAFRNCIAYVKPYIDHNNFGKYAYKIDVLAPHQYDVIEDMRNPEIPRVIILSDYVSEPMAVDDNPQNRVKHGLASNFRDGDGRSQIIADSPNDNEHKEYIFWSPNYHFTTDYKGNIISVDENGETQVKNPIGMLPFESFSKDQDDSYWSVGGEDMVEGSILINTLMTDLYFIAKIQGMGLFYLFAKNAPKQYKIGPNRAITIDLEEGDPTPSIGFASSNPPINDHMSMIEQYVAFLLTTNDLGTNSIQGKLDGTSAASGIQEIIQNAEPMTAVEDEQAQYMEKESRLVMIANEWQKVYSDSVTGLRADLDEIGYVDDIDYSLKFVKQAHFNSENEKLDAINKKIDQGIYNKVDAMIEDNPDLTRDEALELLLQKSDESLQLMQTKLNDFIKESMMPKVNDGDSSKEESEAESEQGSEREED